jgi:septum formation protein
VCFKTKEKTQLINETTSVTFHPITDQEIDYYLTTYRPFDKAGSYGIQEWIGYVGVAKIEGSYPNVMGMPTDKVYHFLNQL